MSRSIDLLSTIDHSPFRSFLPGGWDLARIRACTQTKKADALRRRKFWHPRFAR